MDQNDVAVIKRVTGMHPFEFFGQPKFKDDCSQCRKFFPPLFCFTQKEINLGVRFIHLAVLVNGFYSASHGGSVQERPACGESKSGAEFGRESRGLAAESTEITKGAGDRRWGRQSVQVKVKEHVQGDHGPEIDAGSQSWRSPAYRALEAKKPLEAGKTA